MPTREYTVKIKDTARVHLYPVRRKAQGKRGKRNKETSEIQAQLNQKNREHQLADILNINFTADDLFVRLSYANQPETVQAADMILYNFFRRNRYYRKNNNLPPLKFIYVTEQGTQSGRIHHHVFLSGDIDRDTIEKMWGYGYANTRRLQFDEKGLVGLTKYMAKGKRAKKSKEKKDDIIVARTWNSSHNLKKPMPNKEIFQNDYRIKAADAAHIDENPEDYKYIEKLYPDYYVAEVETTPRDLTDASPEEKTPIPKAHFVTLYLFRRDADFLKTRFKNRGKNSEKRTESNRE